jgi:hypothetical protein
MTVKKTAIEEQRFTDDSKNYIIKYYLLETNETGAICYGTALEKYMIRDGELFLEDYSEVEKITYNQSEATTLIETLAKGVVTPLGLVEAVDEILSDS